MFLARYKKPANMPMPPKTGTKVKGNSLLSILLEICSGKFPTMPSSSRRWVSLYSAISRMSISRSISAWISQYVFFWRVLSRSSSSKEAWEAARGLAGSSASGGGEEEEEGGVEEEEEEEDAFLGCFLAKPLGAGGWSLLSSAAAWRRREEGKEEEEGEEVEGCLLLCRTEEEEEEEAEGKVGRRKAAMKEGRRTRTRRTGTRTAGGPLEVAAGMVLGGSESAAGPFLSLS